ncbi:MAG: tRNA (adenosine(37)-N6)-dimethylallyltransferase MiaA [Bacteroidetes bacterium GWF2_49_14]|nr:MAG: tRNA (adenosine(37)-N6)-dimethylallyltransferase MiaA [Bacteroidetes bacterium GWF2_49_14]
MPTLVIISGPTAVGKTDVSIRLAQRWHTEIVSCDSRQFYREMRIGTAVPEPEELATIRHHFIGNLSIHDYYSVYRYEQEAISLLNGLFESHNRVIMTGGSGLYMDSILNGIDIIPDPAPEIREQLKIKLDQEGIGPLLLMLQQLDPEYFDRVDKKNPARILRGLEVCMSTGRTFSSFRKREPPIRSFNIRILSLVLPREELYAHIDQRVDRMMEVGLLEEARTLLPWRHLSALNTVGYRELFAHFDGETDLAEAIRLIKRNTRHYARRQITWNNRYRNLSYFSPGELDKIANYCELEI